MPSLPGSPYYTRTLHQLLPYRAAEGVVNLKGVWLTDSREVLALLVFPSFQVVLLAPVI